MAKAKNYIATISNNSHYITENLDVDEAFLSYLLSRDALGQQQIEKINARTTSRDKAFLFKQIIVKRGENAFVAFIDALMATRQVDLATKLAPDIVDTWSGKEIAKMTEGLNITEASVRGDYFVGDEGDPEIDIRLKTVPQNLVKQVLADKEKYYQLTSRVRGLAIILSIENFLEGENPLREGGELDAKNLKKLYKELRFQVEDKEWKDLDAEGIIKKMDELVDRKMPGDAFIFTILSHGDKNSIQASCRNMVHVEKDITAKISKCKSLANKPKIIFVQACRGGEESKIQSDSASRQDGANDKDTTTTATDVEHTDCYILHSTLPGYRAYRNTKLGSWFVRALIYAFMEKGHDGDMSDISNQIAQRLEGMSLAESNERQMCQKVSHLKKTLYFLPNYP